MDDSYQTLTIPSAWDHRAATLIAVRARPNAPLIEVSDRCYITIENGAFYASIDIAPDEARKLASMLWRVAGLQEEANAARQREEAAQ